MKNGVSGKFVPRATNLLKSGLHRHFGIASRLLVIQEQFGNLSGFAQMSGRAAKGLSLALGIKRAFFLAPEAEKGNNTEPMERNNKWAQGLSVSTFAWS